MPPVSKYGLLAMFALCVLSAILLWPRDEAGPGGRRKKLTHVTYAVATADLDVSYPFATLPKSLGYYRDEGLDVDVVPGQSSAAVIQLLLSGRADVGIAVPSPVMSQVAEKDAPLVSVYPAARTSDGGPVVKVDSPLQTVADLRGRKLGIPDYGSGGTWAVRQDLIAANVPESEVKLIAIGYGTPSFEALQRGAVDAADMASSGFTRALVAGYKFRVLPRSPDEIQKYSFNLYARRDYIEKHPDVIIGLGRAMAKGTVFLQTNPEAAVKIFWQTHPDRAPKDPNDRAAFQDALQILNSQRTSMGAAIYPATFAWGSQTAETYTRMQDSLARVGMIKHPVDVTKYFTNRFAADYSAFDHNAVIQQAKSWRPAQP